MNVKDYSESKECSYLTPLGESLLSAELCWRQAITTGTFSQCPFSLYTNLKIELQ